MPKGQPALVGETRISQNGYEYTRTPVGWVLTHRMIAEDMILGRKLRHNERVKFRNNDRTDLSPNNIYVVEKKSTSSIEKRRAWLQAKIDELQAQLEELE